MLIYRYNDFKHFFYRNILRFLPFHYKILNNMYIHNFSAGPSILPKTVFEEASKAVIDFTGNGLSILEISHRSKDFIKVMDEAEALVRELLSIKDDYAVLFLSGGASTQFFMAPMNLLKQTDKVAYTDTGTWASKAIKEAKLLAEVDVVTSSKDDNYMHLPKDIVVNNQHKYLHITSNNTIYGTQYATFPEVVIPLVCDMSSDIFSLSSSSAVTCVTHAVHYALVIVYLIRSSLLFLCIFFFFFK